MTTYHCRVVMQFESNCLTKMDGDSVAGKMTVNRTAARQCLLSKMIQTKRKKRLTSGQIGFCVQKLRSNFEGPLRFSVWAEVPCAIVVRLTTQLYVHIPCEWISHWGDNHLMMLSGLELPISKYLNLIWLDSSAWHSQCGFVEMSVRHRLNTVLVTVVALLPSCHLWSNVLCKCRSNLITDDEWMRVVDH